MPVQGGEAFGTSGTCHISMLASAAVPGCQPTHMAAKSLVPATGFVGAFGLSSPSLLAHTYAWLRHYQHLPPVSYICYS